MGMVDHSVCEQMCANWNREETMNKERMLRAFANGLTLTREKLVRRQANLARFSPQQRVLQYKQELEKAKMLIMPNFLGERFKMIRFRKSS